MLNFFKSLFGGSEEKKESNSLPDLLSELIDISNGMGEYSPLDMIEEEKDSKGREMLSRIRSIELKSKKFNDDELFYLLALSYRNYTAWYVKDYEREKYLKKCLSILKKVSKSHKVSRAELGRLLIEEKLVRNLPLGIEILEELNSQNELPSYLNSTLAKATSVQSSIKRRMV